MNVNLESLRKDIERYLSSRDLVIFRSYPRLGGGSSGAVYWDTENYPGFEEFVEAAIALGVRMIAVHSGTLSNVEIEDALGQLEHANLDSSERRSVETRLREIGAYADFVSQIELSFDDGGRTYVFELTTEWFEDFKDLLTQIEEAFSEISTGNPLGGYYSSNN